VRWVWSLHRRCRSCTPTCNGSPSARPRRRRLARRPWTRRADRRTSTGRRRRLFEGCRCEADDVSMPAATTRRRSGRDSRRRRTAEGTGRIPSPWWCPHVMETRPSPRLATSVTCVSNRNLSVTARRLQLFIRRWRLMTCSQQDATMTLLLLGYTLLTIGTSCANKTARQLNSIWQKLDVRRHSTVVYAVSKSV